MRPLQNPALVAFEAQEVVGPQFLSDERRTRLLAVEGVGGDQAARQRPLGEFPEQGLEGRNFIALFLDGFLRHRQAQAVAHGRE